MSLSRKSLKGKKTEQLDPMPPREGKKKTRGGVFSATDNLRRKETITLYALTK